MKYLQKMAERPEQHLDRFNDPRDGVGDGMKYLQKMAISRTIKYAMQLALMLLMKEPTSLHMLTGHMQTLQNTLGMLSEIYVYGLMRTEFHS